MDQKIISTLSITSKLWLVMLTFAFLTGCEKEVQKRHKDVLEVTLNGITYDLSIDNNSGTPGENAFIQGSFKSESSYVGLVLDLCNLEAWPNQKSFPIFKDSCNYFNIGFTQSTIGFRIGQNKITTYTTQNLVPDGFSLVEFEEFKGTSNTDYEIKGTFRMKLPGNEMNPPEAADSCLVTGRFHFKRPL